MVTKGNQSCRLTGAACSPAARLLALAASRAGAKLPQAELRRDAPQARRSRMQPSTCPAIFRKAPIANGKPLDREPPLQPRHQASRTAIKRMLTRVGFDGSIRQTLLPVAAHDVEVAPDRSIGVLCSMDGEQHTAFDPETLEMAAIGAFARRRLARRRPCRLSRRRQDGHPVGARAVDARSGAGSDTHYGRLTVRDPEDAQDRRKLFDARHRPARHPADRPTANTSWPPITARSVSAKTGQHTIPRSVVQASITVIEVSSGKLVDKRVTGKGEIELRHLAAGRLDRIFAIQARYGSDHEDARQRGGDEHRLRERHHHRARATTTCRRATLKYDAAPQRLTKMGDAQIDQADAARPVDPLRRAPRRGDRHLSEHAPAHGVRRRDAARCRSASTRAPSACAIPAA